MIKLSVNINKVATIRNARGNNIPNLTKFAIDCEKYGADGITVHPRPDGRHIKYDDVFDLKKVVKTEFNIEGYPDKNFIDMVLKVKPEQVTLVPDPPGVLTSNAGWDTKTNLSFLKEIITEFNNSKIRTSIFVDTNFVNIENAVATGTNRIELYTEPYAHNFSFNKENAIAPFKAAAIIAKELGLGVNAGHDLNQENLEFFASQIPFLSEVSIGHAIISDALYLGIENVIGIYKRKLNSAV
jgi:pyridoxine 5-phosphate synthase